MLNELAPGVFWMAPDHRTDRPVIAAVAGDRATLMVDAGSSPRHARQFLDALGAKGLPPVEHVVLTHWHWDHVFGASAIEAALIATPETRREVAAMATYSWEDAALDERVASGLEIPFCRDMIRAELSKAERAQLSLRVPDHVFRSELVVELGGRPVRVLHVGGDHAPDSCIVVVPGVAAFLSDCVYQNLHEEPHFLTRRRLFPLFDRLLALDVASYVLGHGDEPLSRAAFQSMADRLRTAGRTVQRHAMDDPAIQDALAEAGVERGHAEMSEFVRAFQAGLKYEFG